MPYTKNVFFSRPSSPPDSPLSSEKSLRSTRQLTRQRKFRHATEFDLGLQPVEVRSKSVPVSPNRGSLSPTSFRHRSVPAVPQPLPLPDLSSFLKAEDKLRLQINGRPRVGEDSSSSPVTRG